MMNLTAQVAYEDFIEVFKVDVYESSLHITLEDITRSPLKFKDSLLLDLKGDVSKAYEQIPLEDNSILLIQKDNKFFFCINTSKESSWYSFSAHQLIDYVLKDDFITPFLRYFDEDKNIVLNSFLSDLIRNDYSYSAINKIVKFLKILSITKYIQVTFQDVGNLKRVVVDESVIGDFDVSDFCLAFRNLNSSFLKLNKIDNFMKIFILLKENDKIKRKFIYSDNCALINQPRNGNRFRVIFRSEKKKAFSYDIINSKNYVFELDDNYSISLGDMDLGAVSDKLFVYNGDQRDLLMSSN